MNEPKPLLPEIETGNDEADRLYRRLLDRRRRLIEPHHLVIDDPAGPADDGANPVPPMPAAIDPEAPMANAEGSNMTAPDPGNQPPPAHAAAVFLPDDDAERSSDFARPGSGPAGWMHPRLSDWHPESQTMRFIKDHPALTIAIGVPTLIVLARNGGLKRLVRYASSPAGMARIRQIAAVAAGLGLLSKRR
ncbi:MAG: hypothetical protein ABWZ78_13940 [Burkholderiaceae bacterium]